jgi:hypothetical protein
MTWRSKSARSYKPEHINDGGAKAHYGYIVIYGLLCLALVLAASSLCLFWAPQAAGGGVTQVMAYLNGTHIPQLLGWKALVAKIIGVVCACGSSLAVGPEGPMVHIGAAVASCLTLILPKMYLGEVRGGEEHEGEQGHADERASSQRAEVLARADDGDGDGDGDGAGDEAMHAGDKEENEDIFETATNGFAPNGFAADGFAPGSGDSHATTPRQHSGIRMRNRNRAARNRNPAHRTTRRAGAFSRLLMVGWCRLTL